MAEIINSQTTVVSTSEGLFIAGTRITVYDVMDYLKAGWPTKLVQNWLNLTERQITDVMDYIENHREEVEAEYQQVLQYSEEIRLYWERRNRKRFAKIAAMPPKPGREEARARLQAWKSLRN
ncbi:DUF433 domain-containing protein [candidate division KSB1 bacterium RBG_16_48_16]|nr:MAG: DUF433 domain-containing protein [candidate division KSB1 bacterium RBG_16_48_16]